MARVDIMEIEYTKGHHRSMEVLTDSLLALHFEA